MMDHGNTTPDINDDGWNWPWLLYIGKKWLNLTEEEFWAKTPRQYHSLLDTHKEITQLLKGTGKKEKTKPTVDFIDKIPGW